MTRKVLPAASAETISDPAWLHAKILDIVAAADEFAAQHPDKERVANRRIAFQTRIESLATDIRLHTELGHQFLADLREQAPDLAWVAAAQGIGGFAESDERAAEVAEKLGLPEAKPLSNGGRLWLKKTEFEVRIYGPIPAPEESDQ